MKLAVCWSFSG